MSDQTPETPPEGTEGTETTEAKPTETVEFWKQKAREQEKRAKDNATAAKRLGEIEDAQKSESEKTADRIAKADAEVASVPAKVAEALKAHLVALHQIDTEDADLFLTATDPELMLRQVDRLMGQSGKRKTQGNHVPREGTNPAAPKDEAREFVGNLFGAG